MSARLSATDRSAGAAGRSTPGAAEHARGVPRSDYEYVEGWGMAVGATCRVLRPRGVDEILAMVREVPLGPEHEFVDVGCTKFVVIPLAEPADAEAWATHLGEGAEVLLTLER